MHIGYVYFHNRSGNCAYRVVQCYAGVRVCPGVEYYAVGCEAGGVYAVDEFAFLVALVVVYRYVGVFLAQCGEVCVEAFAAVNAGFAHAEQV